MFLFINKEAIFFPNSSGSNKMKGRRLNESYIREKFGLDSPRFRQRGYGFFHEEYCVSVDFYDKNIILRTVIRKAGNSKCLFWTIKKQMNLIM
ncbi:hypothetical protein BES34_021540, partial [Leptospira inadai serovar Lyme]